MYTFDNDFLLFESNLSVIIYLSPNVVTVQGIHQLLVKPKYFGETALYFIVTSLYAVSFA